MQYGLSDQVRAVAVKKYIHPAILAGKGQFSVAVRDLMEDLRAEGFPAKNWPQICTALRAEKFLRVQGFEIEAVEGPPSQMSTTVVVRYRVAKAQRSSHGQEAFGVDGAEATFEDASGRAMRLTGKLRGLLKEEFAEFGGGEAFLRWVRSEGEEAE